MKSAHMNWHSQVRQRRTTLISPNGHSPSNSQGVMVASRQLPTDFPYILPWNMEEVSRQDFQHYLLRQAMSGNYCAPLKRPKNILDVGCGTGRWAQEMAQAFPDANVIGLDIFDPPVETNASTKPSNYQFVMADVLKGLPFSPYQFDFVHQRSLNCVIPTPRWLQVVNELVRVTRPGGIIELVEPDSFFQNAGPACTQIQKWIVKACQKCGIDPTEGAQIGTYLQVSGLINVTTETITLPIGQWGGRLGSTTATNMRAACLAMKPLVLQHLGISSEEYDRSLEDMFKECEQYQSQFVICVAYGQRPFR
jgi:ubiquinone/menaquinone biosynthesis C-methylase UbiE